MLAKQNNVNFRTATYSWIEAVLEWFTHCRILNDFVLQNAKCNFLALILSLNWLMLKQSKINGFSRKQRTTIISHLEKLPGNNTGSRARKLVQRHRNTSFRIKKTPIWAGVLIQTIRKWILKQDWLHNIINWKH